MLVSSIILIDLKIIKILCFFLFYGKIGKRIDERANSESKIDNEQLDESIEKLINAAITEYHGCDGDGAGTKISKFLNQCFA